MSLIKLENVSKFYKSGDGVSVGMRKISLDFNLGEFIAVTGESGSGKSTLLNVISGLDSYEDGELSINNEETSHFIIKDWENYRSKYVGFIFQNYNIIDSYTVYENVILALEIQNYPKQLRKKRALELIEKVGLLSHKNHKAAKLSGGQKQRAVIARALAKDCPIIVADEPTGNLDSESGKQVIELLKSISKDKLVIMVTHDYDQVEKYATRRIKMHDGEVIEDKLLKSFEEVSNPIELKVAHMSLGTVLLFALRNILSMPRRFIFFMLLQIMIILVFTFSYTNLMVTARSQNFGGGFGTLPNVSGYFDFNTSAMSDNRMNIVRKDGLMMNQTDLNYFNGLNDITHIYKDVTYMDSVEFSHAEVEDSSGYNNYISSFTLDSSISIADEPQFLVDGSMSNLLDNEIIISNGFVDIPIGSEITLYAYYDEIFELTLEGTNSGIYSWTIEGDLYDQLLTINYISDREPVKFSYYNNYIDFQSEFGWSEEDILDIDYIVVNATVFMNQYRTFEVKGIYNDNFKNAIYLSHDFLEMPSFGHTFSVISKNSISGERLFNAIDKSIYRVIYPELNRDAIQQLFAPLNFLLSLFYYILIYFFAIFLYFILFSVMKNVMNSRKKDFAIFRSIGANESKLGLLVIFEQLLMMIVSFLISMIVIMIIRYYDFSTNLVMEQMLISDYIILFLTFTYLSIWLARRFNKKTFKFSVIENITESKEENL